MTSASRFKDFGGSDDVPLEPLGFSLYGEQFDCYPSIQGGVLLKFVADGDSDDGGRAAEALLHIFERVLLPESYARFKALIDDPTRIVTIEKLGEIAVWLIEVYTKRPTTRPELSSSGESISGLTSTATAL